MQNYENANLDKTEIPMTSNLKQNAINGKRILSKKKKKRIKKDEKGLKAFQNIVAIFKVNSNFFLF